MIFGTVDYSPKGSSFLFARAIDDITGDGMVPNNVHAGALHGCFLLNPRLPYRTSDCYFTDQGRDISVMMSGSVYNRTSLSIEAALKPKATDPELVAELFLMSGPGFVKDVNGDFAILITRPKERVAYLFRDQLGIIPLAFSTDHKKLHFSTDDILLSMLLEDNRGPDPDYLTKYFRFPDYRRAPGRLVRKLMPGHWLRFDENGYELHKYWEPEKVKPEKSLRYDTMLSDLGEILKDSVNIRCDSRFTAGAHVSGGLDSGVVAVLARRGFSGQKQFCGFSLSPHDFKPGQVSFDERESVNKLCDGHDVTPVFSRLTSDDLLRFTEEFRFNQGYFADEELLARARSLKVNLLFSGWGGDEFISTGSRSIDTDLFLGLRWRTFFRRHPFSRPRRLLRALSYGVLLPILRIKGRTISESLAMDAMYLRKEYRKGDREAIKAYFLQSSRRRHHLGMLSSYHLQDRCEAWYTAGWRMGVVYRYPLLDKRIIEYMLKVPSDLLCFTGEYRPLLRSLGIELLTEEIRINRSKEDPVFGEFIGNIFVEAGQSVVSEIVQWKENPDLRFIDFELIEKDIEKHSLKSGRVDGVNLFRTIVRIRSLHHFTMQYRKGYSVKMTGGPEGQTEELLAQEAM